MAPLLPLMLLMLLIILIAAELFTNALEHLGERLGLAEGVTGSIFAAVATALPETLVPLLAIFGGGDSKLNEEVGVGAILGAPLMLSTLSTGLMALAALQGRGWRGRIRPERAGFHRDLHFFLFAFLLAAVAMVLPPERGPRLLLSGALVLTYLVYLVLTLRDSARQVQGGHSTEAERQLLLARAGLPLAMPAILLQLALALFLLIAGARGFIHSVEALSKAVALPALLLSVLVIPIATELPEKVNSILWVRRGKDTLAFGNITGALVFQGTLLPAIGITLTPWSPRPDVVAGVVLTLVAALWLRAWSRPRGLPALALLVNALLYAVYILLMVL